MVGEKKISIAIATYNGEKYLSKLLDSLFEQTVLPDEIIVSDDCSTDSTVQILQHYSNRHPFIKVICNERNIGVNKNFETAVLNCTGDYILVCDQDDVWLENNIETKILLLEKMPLNEPNLVTSGAVLADKNLSPIRNISLTSDVTDWKELFFRCFQGTTMAFNKHLLKLCNKWPASFSNVPYDYYIYCVALLSGNVYASSKPLMYYRSHEGNVSFRSGKIKNCLKRVFPTYRLTEIRMSYKGLMEMKYAFDSLPFAEIKQDRLVFFNELILCARKGGIAYLKFINLSEISFFMKVKVVVGSLVSHIK